MDNHYFLSFHFSDASFKCAPRKGRWIYPSLFVSVYASSSLSFFSSLHPSSLPVSNVDRPVAAGPPPLSQRKAQISSPRAEEIEGPLPDPLPQTLQPGFQRSLLQLWSKGSSDREGGVGPDTVSRRRRGDRGVVLWDVPLEAGSNGNFFLARFVSLSASRFVGEMTDYFDPSLLLANPRAVEVLVIALRFVRWGWEPSGTRGVFLFFF